MSVHHKVYTSKKTGIKTIRYYASVYNAQSGKSVVGPYREYVGPELADPKKPPKAIEKQLKLDEASLIDAIAKGKVEKKKAGLLFEVVAKQWLSSCKPPVFANSTYEGYSYYYSHYIFDVFGDRPINKITPLHILKYVDAMKEKYSAETVNKCINILIDIFNYAITPLKEITVNPASDIKRVKVSRPQMKVWSDYDVQYFLNLPEVKCSEYYAMFCISLLIGSRPSEVCGMSELSLLDNPKRLDFWRGYDQHGSISNMKTDGSHRIIRIPDILYKSVHRRLLWKKEQQLKNPSFSDNDFLFVTKFGNPIRPNLYSKAFKRIVVQHNECLNKMDEIPNGHRLLPVITLYGCRHSFATNALAGNNDPALISSIMGNSVKTLLTRYAHPNQERQLSLINDFADKALKKVSQSIS